MEKVEILKVNNLKKSFKDNIILDDLSCSVKQGEVFGFLGKNGAGKTTTMKMILGFLKPNSGSIKVCGELVSFGNTKTNKNIGYLPDVPEFYGYMTPLEYLNLCGEISGVDKKKIKEKSIELLELVGLNNLNRKISGFSRGMKQRLGIAQALINEPKLLICDEPTSALDPVGRKEILDILQCIKGDTTIVFSTHILSDVERICDTIGVLDKGKMVLQGKLQEIKKDYRQDKILIQSNTISGLRKLEEHIILDSNVIKVDLDKNTMIITLKDLENTSMGILNFIISNKIPLLKYEVCEPSLESMFLEVIS
ncbi:ABC transporter ATP-binding protein [Hathewaya limosa]|uniref:ABC-2 type transport system ATP-binding protein n=1 Tax=Hathewaya limosa TaxID=1536 RepID=A0ABU0JXA2_HATLI|nr:ABC transporter ATP-binding protein [Hathewaya limosa]MDQ0480537.1 ABC-2 type transport system ATP-binding protein [Hathewaya limosa]